MASFQIFFPLQRISYECQTLLFVFRKKANNVGALDSAFRVSTLTSTNTDSVIGKKEENKVVLADIVCSQFYFPRLLR